MINGALLPTLVNLRQGIIGVAFDPVYYSRQKSTTNNAQNLIQIDTYSYTDFKSTKKWL